MTVLSVVSARPPWNFFVGRPHYTRTGGRLQSFNAADVIEMMVGDQNIAQLPAWVGRQPGLDRRGVTRVNNRAAALLQVLQQPYIVIGECGQGIDFYHQSVAKQGTKVHLRVQWRCWLCSTACCASALLR